MLGCTHPIDRVDWAVIPSTQEIAVVDGKMHGVCLDCGLNVQATIAISIVRGA